MIYPRASAKLKIKPWLQSAGKTFSSAINNFHRSFKIYLNQLIRCCILPANRQLYFLPHHYQQFVVI